MKKYIYFFCALIMCALCYSQNTYARSDKDEDIEIQIADENADIERFNGFSEDIVWQVVCTELYQIYTDKNEYGLWTTSYLEHNGYNLMTQVIPIYVSKIANLDEAAIEDWKETWSYGFNENVVPEETKYYKLMEALENYAETQSIIGDPVYFNYTDSEQETFNNYAKEGFIPEYYINNTRNNTSTETEQSPQEEVDAKDLDTDSTEQAPATKKKFDIKLFFRGGGITLVLMVISGILYLVAYKKRKRNELK